MNILVVSPEVFPFAKTGGLADVAGFLPQALVRIGHKVSIIMPLYRMVGKNGFVPKPFKNNLEITLGGNRDSFNLRVLKHDNLTIYFIEKDEYFDRDQLYGTPHGDYADNAVRFGFFAKSVLCAIPYIGKVDILHINDWQSSLIPLYLRLFHSEDADPKDIKTFFTIHNMAYQGLFEKDVMPSIDLPEGLFNMYGLEFYGKLNLMKGAIIYSDAIGTVSAGYAREILTEEFGCGLHGLLRTREKDLYGVLNGVDYSIWNPATDKFIIKNYNDKNLAPKLECKKDLLKQFDIKYNKDKFVIGMITRLAEQKGIDLVAAAMKDMLKMGFNFVLLGTGDEKYNNMFTEMQKLYKGEIGIKIAFDEALAHKIEAGSDMFLMPSRYEPCGLNQMYSLKYGTVPIVRAVGGLNDTIEDFNPSTKKGNGFKFREPSVKSLLDTIKRAAKVFKDKNLKDALIKNCLSYDFSWDASAKKYAQIYHKILSS